MNGPNGHCQEDISLTGTQVETKNTTRWDPESNHLQGWKSGDPWMCGNMAQDDWSETYGCFFLLLIHHFWGVLKVLDPQNIAKPRALDGEDDQSTSSWTFMETHMFHPSS